MIKFFKLAQNYFEVLSQDEDIPSTLRAPFSYQERDEEDLGSKSTDKKGITLELTHTEVEALNFLMSALKSDVRILKILLKDHGKTIINTIDKFNHYAAQARAEQRTDEDYYRVASVARRMKRSLAAIEYEDWDMSDEPPQTVRNPGAVLNYPTSSAPTQRRPQIWEEEADDEFVQVFDSPDTINSELVNTERAYRHPESSTVSVDSFTRNELEILAQAIYELSKEYSSRPEKNKQAIDQTKKLLDKLEQVLSEA